MAGARPAASLENLIERGDLGIEILHPGGVETTRKLASLCGIRPGDRVLDVAAGTGETARFLVERLGAEVVGVDRSESMVRRARGKARGVEGRMRLVRADAHALPFRSGGLDHAICECTLSLLDKRRALAEMVRVVRPGGCVGFHEICWREDAPLRLRERLVELEHERPETLAGWADLLARFDVGEVRSEDLSGLIPQWMERTRRELGPVGFLRAARGAIGAWGVRGLLRILRSERIFRSEYLGYGMVVGTKR